MAVRAPRLLGSALWLAGSSAFLALTLYLLDAPYAAAIELSVGAGLVAVLFVLAVTSTHSEGVTRRTLIPRWLAVGLPVLCAGLVGWFLLPNLWLPTTPYPTSFGQVFWHDRALDVLGQLTLLFVAALGVVVLMRRPAHAGEMRSEPRPKARAEEPTAVHEKERVRV
jgi:uncharacterized MnhB-related membrane protein